MTSRLHGVWASKGRPWRLHLGEGQCSDFPGADGVLKDWPPATAVIGDQGDDREKIRKMLAEQGIWCCIPPRRRKKVVDYNKGLYKQESVESGSHNRDPLFPTEGVASPCNPPGPLCLHLLLCHPPGCSNHRSRRPGLNPGYNDWGGLTTCRYRARSTWVKGPTQGRSCPWRMVNTAGQVRQPLAIKEPAPAGQTRGQSSHTGGPKQRAKWANQRGRYAMGKCARAKCAPTNGPSRRPSAPAGQASAPVPMQGPTSERAIIGPGQGQRQARGPSPWPLPSAPAGQCRTNGGAGHTAWPHSLAHCPPG